MLNRHGPIEAFPEQLLGADTERALLFKRLATLRVDAPLFKSVDALLWKGPTKRFSAWARMADAPALEKRVHEALERRC